jgi:4-amino-4-deoxy-L-arabinose transferase-like glycosyltransferase
MKRVNTELALVTLILFLSVLVRMWGLDYDLPFIYHPDEHRYITISQNIFKTGDLNPHFFNYPSLFFYINALTYVPYYILGKLSGVFNTPSDILPPISLTMGVTQAQTPIAVLLGRIVTVCFGVGTVGLVHLSGKQLTGRTSVGILASLMVAISPTSVLNSRFVTPDTFVAFFTMVSFLASVLVYHQGETWHYLVAGICIGLTASSKYNGGMIVLSLIVAHFLHYGKASFKQPKLYLALLLCGIAFLATTPFAVLDFAEFMDDFSFEAQHYAIGHAGMEGNTLTWYLNYMWNSGGGLYLLAVLGILYGSSSHPRETTLLLVFPVTYFAFISSFAIRNNRTLLPLIPFLFLSAAWFLVDVFDRIRTWQPGLWQRLSSVVLVSLVIAVLAFPTSKMVEHTRRRTTVNSRETARIWINDNLPFGAKIAIEPYSPFIDPSRFSIQAMQVMGLPGQGTQATEHEPDWYLEQGFDYLVFSEGMYGRFYQDPERYSAEVLQYDSLFRRFSLVAVFKDGDYEVRIYRVK